MSGPEVCLDQSRPGTLVPRSVGHLRRRARTVVPFAVRSTVIRAPHLLAWLTDRPTVERVGSGGERVCERRSPLRRPGTTYDEVLQRAKETNVRRAAQALDGVRIAPGATLSWHAVLGPPLRLRGFAAGPELHDGLLARGAGGGACQVANLLFWLGAHAGMEVIERHRHGQDLFPDAARTVPFGCGATVFYPHSDLKLRNPHPTGLRLSFRVTDTHLEGRLGSEEPLNARYRLEERDHRFFRRDGAVWRANRIVRIVSTPDGTREELLVENLARVAYPVDLS